MVKKDLPLLIPIKKSVPLVLDSPATKEEKKDDVKKSIPLYIRIK